MGSPFSTLLIVFCAHKVTLGQNWLKNFYFFTRISTTNIVVGRILYPETLWGQTVYFVHCKRIPQQAKVRFVAESATLLVFFDLLRCFGFDKQIPKTLPLKIAPKIGDFAESATVFAESRSICRIHKQTIRHLYS